MGNIMVSGSKGKYCRLYLYMLFMALHIGASLIRTPIKLHIACLCLTRRHDGHWSRLRPRVVSDEAHPSLLTLRNMHLVSRRARMRIQRQQGWEYRIQIMSYVIFVAMSEWDHAVI